MVKTKLTPGRVALYAVLSLGSLLMVGPFIWMILTALKSTGEVGTFTWLPREFHWSNFVEAMDAAPFLRYFWNSLYVSTITTVLAVVVAVPAA